MYDPLFSRIFIPDQNYNDAVRSKTNRDISVVYIWNKCIVLFSNTVVQIDVYFKNYLKYVFE